MALLEQILQENARFTAELPESYIHRNDKVANTRQSSWQFTPAWIRAW